MTSYAALAAFGIGSAAVLHRVRLRKRRAGNGGGRGGGHSVVADDPSSFANPREVRTTHLDLDLVADFGAKQLRGTVTLTCAVQAATVGGAATVVLDTRSIAVDAVELASANGVATGGANGGDAPALAFAFGEAHKNLGTPLTVTVPGAWRKGDTFQLRVAYATAPGARHDSAARRLLCRL